jgi:hypothetical protein
VVNWVSSPLSFFLSASTGADFLTLQIPLKEGIGGEREGDFTDSFITSEFFFLSFQAEKSIPSLHDADLERHRSHHQL